MDSTKLHVFSSTKVGHGIGNKKERIKELPKSNNNNVIEEEVAPKAQKGGWNLKRKAKFGAILMSLVSRPRKGAKMKEFVVDVVVEMQKFSNLHYHYIEVPFVDRRRGTQFCDGNSRFKLKVRVRA